MGIWSKHEKNSVTFQFGNSSQITEIFSFSENHPITDQGNRSMRLLLTNRTQYLVTKDRSSIY